MTWHREYRKYEARLMEHGRHRRLGYFDTPEAGSLQFGLGTGTGLGLGLGLGLGCHQRRGYFDTPTLTQGASPIDSTPTLTLTLTPRLHPHP